MYNKTVFAYLPASYSGDYTVPDGIRYIAGGAFSDCTDLTAVTIPNGVTGIEFYAFWGCTGLTSVTIPNTLTYIRDDVFHDCSNITAFEGPFLAYDSIPYDKMETVIINGGSSEDLSASSWSNHLVKLDLGALEASSIPDYMLNDRHQLRELILPAGVETIGYMSFAGCMDLDQILIPASVKQIGKRAFEDCRSLAKLEFEPESQLQTIGDWAFYNCHELPAITLPEGVTEIGKAAFYGCTYAESLSLPASVQSIGDNAFALCAKLARLDVDAVLPPTIMEKTFYDVSRKAPVYVPDGSVDLYKGDAFWGQMNIVGRSEAPLGIDRITDAQTARKVLSNGEILILRGDKTYTVTGIERR